MKRRPQRTRTDRIDRAANWDAFGNGYGWYEGEGREGGGRELEGCVFSQHLIQPFLEIINRGA